jgi:hypothetical protein
VEPLDDRDLEDFERVDRKLLSALGPGADEGGPSSGKP